MDFAEAIDRMIEPFAPRLVRKRMAERMALTVMRQYDVAMNGRRTQGWRRTSASADREVRQGLVAARNSASELVRNNKFAAAAVNQVVTHMVGDGIAPRAVHADKDLARKAQDGWDRWAEGRVDGRNDYYGTQKLGALAMVERGEGLKVWSPDAVGPDGRCRVLEGDFLDHLKNDETSARRIVQGVQFNDIGDRVGYWLFGSHPGDVGGYHGASTLFDAAHVDHLFAERRAGQTRGISWLAPVALDLRDIADGDQAWLMRHKAEACIALILTPGDDDTPTGPFNEVNGESAPGEGNGKGRKPSESLRPGMVFRARKGESVSSLNPTPSSGATEFKRQQLMGIAANLAPYHLIAGDPNGANYSGLRSMMIAFHANLDDWQQNIMVPLDCKPAWERRMRRLYLETGDRRFLEVRAKWAMPARPYIDKLKEVAGEVAEVRAGFKSMSQSLSERGRNPDDHYEEMRRDNEVADAAGLALETDPRRVTQSGILQAAAGYLAGQSQAKEDN